MIKVSRTEILNDPLWIKFQPIVFDRSEQQDNFDKEHVSLGHVVNTSLYKNYKSVKLIECWTCRIMTSFGFITDKSKEKFVTEEHWLYNDWPEEYQTRIIGSLT